MYRLLRPWLFASLLAPLAACHAPSTSPLGAGGNTGKEDSLFPTGSDKLGYIDIHPADGAALALAPTSDVHVLIDGVDHGMPAAPIRVVAGLRRIELALPDWGTVAYSRTERVVEKAKTVDVGLSGLHVDGYTEYPVELGWRLGWGADNEQLAGGVLTETAATPGQYLPILPVPFSLELRADKVVSSHAITPTPGKVEVVDLATADPRVTFKVSSPDRTLPSYLTPASTFYASAVALPQLFPPGVTHDWALKQLWQQNRGTGVAAGDEGKTARAIASPFTDVHYYFAVGTFFVELTGGPGETVEAPLRRLDVNHVAVEDETGKTTTYTGSWSLARKMPNGEYDAPKSYSAIPTGFGLDVPPGEYRVVVTYARQEEPTPDSRVYEIEIK